MLDAGTRERIGQEEYNCLAAKHLHVKGLKKFERKIFVVDTLAVVIPAVYFPLRYIFKGTCYATGIEAIWEVLAGCLIAATIWKFSGKWQEKFKSHGKLLGENISLARQAANLLGDTAATSESAKLFLAWAGQAEAEDRELIGEPRKEDRQFAYREALKEKGGPSVTCGSCHSSPWTFVPGSCDACGNTPIKHISH